MITQSDMNNAFVNNLFGNNGKKIMKRYRKTSAEKKAELEKLKVGDVVEIKCGGPSMVVVEVQPNGANNPEVCCCYYEGAGPDNRGYVSRYFPEAALRKREEYNFYVPSPPIGVEMKSKQKNYRRR